MTLKQRCRLWFVGASKTAFYISLSSEMDWLSVLSDFEDFLNLLSQLLLNIFFLCLICSLELNGVAEHVAQIDYGSTLKYLTSLQACLHRNTEYSKTASHTYSTIAISEPCKQFLVFVFQELAWVIFVYNYRYILWSFEPDRFNRCYVDTYRLFV